MFSSLQVRQAEKKKRRNQFSDHFFSSYFDDDDDDDTNLNDISLTRSEVNERNLQLEVERDIEIYNDVTIAQDVSEKDGQTDYKTYIEKRGTMESEKKIKKQIDIEINRQTGQPKKNKDK